MKNTFPTSYISVRPLDLGFLFCGFLFALLIVLDPYISNTIFRGTLRNILKLHPYDLSSLVLLFFIMLLLLSRVLLKIKINTDKTFVIAFLISYHTVNLTRFAPIIEGTDFVIGIFFLVFVVELLMQDEIPIGKSLVMLNLLFILSILPSSVNRGSPLIFIYSFLKVCKLTLLSFLLANYIYRKKLVKYFVKWFVIFTTISAVIAIFQHVIYKMTGEILVGFLTSAQTRHNFQISPFGLFYRFSGFVSGYKVFSNLLILSLMLILNLCLYDAGIKMRDKLFLFFSFILMSVALLLTFSIDGILVLFLGIILSLIFRWPHLIIHVSMIFLLIVVILSLANCLDDIYHFLVAQFQFGGPRVRIQLVREGIYGFLTRHPLTGIGIDESKRYCAHYLNWPPHHGLVVAADETGVMGLFSFLLMLAYGFYKAFSLNIFVKNSEYIWIARAFFVGFLMFLITINFHPTFTDNILWIYLGSMQAMVARFSREKSLIPNPKM